MARNKPILQSMYSKWEDGNHQYGYDVENPDVRMYVVARTRKDYHIAREEDTDPQEVVEYRYELYEPENLTLEEYQSKKENGWEFVDVSIQELTEWMHMYFKP